MSLAGQVNDLALRVATEINGVRGEIAGGGAGTNLDETLSSTQVVITSDTGTDATIPLVDGTNAGVMSPTMKTKLDGIEAAADVTDAANVASIIHAATNKTTPVANDEIPLIDSAASNVLKRITYAQLSSAVTALLVDGAPGTLDTLNELAAALGDDADYAATITSALGGKQPLDTDLTAIAALTSAANKVAYATGAGTWSLADFTSFGRTLAALADAAAGRTALSVYSTTEIGDPTTDFVATFEGGLA